ncbi:UDP-glycosyltransferase [Melia azedarach]|uniref:UDP-glycosyltransferase n=1 Tax=Melia azedarach TaxID=155640 RepID=A0ACC1YPZ4_MELAZ|nr:UDP-glycosyltransferase [Melia azedarach]
MEVHFEQLLNQLEPPVTNIIADAELFWPIRIEHSDELVDKIPEVSSKQVADLQTIVHGISRRVAELALETLSWVPKTKYLLFNSVYELEAEVYVTVKAKFPFPVYPIGPAIPYLEYDNSSLSISPSDSNHLEWLDHQPTGSVLYVSPGSFLSISSKQMDEIAAGLQISGVRYLWVARRETSRYEKFCGEIGLVVPWCNQLKVLCHSSTGGFWTHCGWNSTLEALFAGVTMLTSPINYDQLPNSKKIVEDWKIGWKITERVEDENFVDRDEIAVLVQRFMDPNSIDVQNMRKKARELREICHRVVAKGGSSDSTLDAFVNDIVHGHSSSVDTNHFH